MTADAGEKLKVFISYSRKDLLNFADQLVVGLGLLGFAPIIEHHKIKTHFSLTETEGNLRLAL